MLFQSTVFLLYFLPIALVGYHFLRACGRYALSQYFLILASLFFYGWWKVEYVPVFLAAVLFNYRFGEFLGKTSAKGGPNVGLLWLGIAVNLSLLFVFKYLGFSLGVWAQVFHMEAPRIDWALPLGISFFTFQNIVYLVDKNDDPSMQYSFDEYLLFLAFFPHLLAGPIVRHDEIIEQFKAQKTFDERQFFSGVLTFLIGLVKKTIVADTLALWVNSGFHRSAELYTVEAWAAAVLFLLQLYFDFSGYTDMAIGTAMMFGIKMPENFNAPLRSTSIIEFWQRWHITLSRFFNRYVYFPIVRCFNKPSWGALMFATFVSTFFAGVWHGAGWTFLLFGLWHASGFLINHAWRRWGIQLPTSLCWLITFIFVTIGGVFFRSPNMQVAFNMLHHMFDPHHIILDPSLFAKFAWLTNLGIHIQAGWMDHLGTLDRKLLLFLFGSMAVILLGKNTAAIVAQQKWTWRSAYLVAVLIVLGINILCVAGSGTEFVYFSF